jgi:diacylglycerol kinase (ATP)
MHIDALSKALLIGGVMLVLIVELINSAIEAIIDRVSLESHVLAKRAKDFGSAAVMLSLINAAVIWILVLFGGNWLPK